VSNARSLRTVRRQFAPPILRWRLANDNFNGAPTRNPVLSSATVAD